MELEYDNLECDTFAPMSDSEDEDTLMAEPELLLAPAPVLATHPGAQPVAQLYGRYFKTETLKWVRLYYYRPGSPDITYELQIDDYYLPESGAYLQVCPKVYEPKRARLTHPDMLIPLHDSAV
jgi:hypothetical protein